MNNLTPTQHIIARWSPRSMLAQDLGVQPYSISHWFARDSIPAQHYAGILASARKRKIRLTMAELVGAKNTHNCQLGTCAPDNQPVQKVNP